MSENKNDNAKDTQTDTKNQVSVSHGDRLPYVSKKIEKLVTALHLVTNFIPTNEPIRVSIRQRALSLLSDVLSHKRNVMTDTAKDVSLRISTTVQEIMSLLRIALESGYVSKMNYDILDREFESLLQILDSGASLAPSVQFGADFFGVESVSGGDDERERTLKSHSSRESKRQKSGDATDSAQKSTQTKGSTTSRSSAKDKRRRIILGLFEDADEITVTDVKEVIQGYSSKTIQRDLASLVDQGILEKRGKRRWTSYILADS